MLRKFLSSSTGGRWRMGGRLRRKEEMMMEWMEGGEAEEKGKTVLP